MYRLVVLVLALATCTQGATIGDRIVGGTDAADGAYPYQVSFRAGGSHFCGGSILNSEYVLTAAHCVHAYRLINSAVRVVAGTNNLNEGGLVYRVRSVIIHPNFSWTLMTGDVALVRIRGPFVFSDKVQPVTLPTEDFTKANYPATLTGWGLLSHPGVTATDLQVITLSVISQEACLARDNWTTANSICTIAPPGEGACRGDSGGPLVADGVQIGIVSYGTPCALGEPDVFARVWSYIGWIRTNARL